MRIPHLSNFAINYTAQKEKRIENNPNALKIKLEITMLEKENLIFVVFSVFVVQSHEKLTFITSANIETIAEI